jgi:hypothetical protein
MEAHSSNTQEIFGPDWDPTAADVLVGDITSTVRDSENGVRLVAEDKGVRLWAEILNGNAIDYRAFAEDGSELGIATFIEPDARLDQPTENELRPLRPDEGPAGNPPPDDGVPGDGGVPGVPGIPQARCKWVCVWAYGAQRCWRKCP